MSMLISWAFCNRGRNPATKAFPMGFDLSEPDGEGAAQVLRPERADNTMRSTSFR